MIILLIGADARSFYQFRLPLIEALQRLGLRVVVAAPEVKSHEALRRHFDREGVEAHDVLISRVGLNPFSDLATIADISKLMIKIKPDVVFNFHIKPAIFGTIAAWLAGVPRRYVMLEGLGYLFVEDVSRRKRWVRAVALLLLRGAFSLARAVIVLNRDDARDLQQWAGLSKSKTRIVNGCGIDLNHYQPRPLANGTTTFLMISRLIRAKGPDFYYRAAAQVRSRYPNARFLLIGAVESGPDAISMAEMERWGERGLIEWIGGKHDVRPYLESSHVVVLPTYYREGVPRTLLEAMATGRPVITTNMPGCREAVEDRVTGILVPPRSDTALASAMIYFLEKPEAVTSMGEAGLRRVRERFAADQVNRQMLEALEIVS